MRSIYVPIEHEPEITVEAFTLAVGYLYSSVALTGVTTSNARAVLATGCFLGGMDELCRYAYETCCASFSLENIEDWLGFIDRATPREEPGSGSGTPTTPMSPTFRGPFLTYAMRLREDMIHFLIVEVPRHLHAFSHEAPSQEASNGSSSGIDALLDIYSHVPFDIFKKAIESPAFGIGSDQVRFRFAKSAIERRKLAGRIAHGGNVEETVVLAFGGASSQGGSNVHVTRKVKKRPLWKVSS